MMTFCQIVTIPQSTTTTNNIYYYINNSGSTNNNNNNNSFSNNKKITTTVANNINSSSSSSSNNNVNQNNNKCENLPHIIQKMIVNLILAECKDKLNKKNYKQCGLVCKRWFDYTAALYSEFNLVNIDIGLPYATQQLHRSFSSPFRLDKYIYRLVLDLGATSQPSTITSDQFAIDTLSNSSSLNLSHLSLKLEAGVCTNRINQILSPLRSSGLTRMKIRNLSIRMRTSSEVDGDALQSIASSLYPICNSLKKLDLFDHTQYSFRPESSSTGFGDDNLTRLIKANSYSLVTMRLSFTRVGADFFSSIFCSPNLYPNLTSLRVQEIDDHFPWHLVSRAAPNLKELSYQLTTWSSSITKSLDEFLLTNNSIRALKSEVYLEQSMAQHFTRFDQLNIAINQFSEPNLKFKFSETLEYLRLSFDNPAFNCCHIFEQLRHHNNIRHLEVIGVTKDVLRQLSNMLIDNHSLRHLTVSFASCLHNVRSPYIVDRDQMAMFHKLLATNTSIEKLDMFYSYKPGEFEKLFVGYLLKNRNLQEIRFNNIYSTTNEVKSLYTIDYEGPGNTFMKLTRLSSTITTLNINNNNNINNYYDCNCTTFVNNNNKNKLINSI